MKKAKKEQEFFANSLKKTNTKKIPFQTARFASILSRNDITGGTWLNYQT